MNTSSGKISITPTRGQRDRTKDRQQRTARLAASSRASTPRRWPMIVAVLAVLAVGALFLIYQNAQGGRNATDGGGGYRHVAGEPGIGAAAPDFALTSTTGETVALGDFRGRNVLLYFQEGLMCQPCWTQIANLEANTAALQAAGIDAVVSISHDPVDQQARKAADENLSTPMLSDPSQQVIRSYDAQKYGMMQGQMAGHSFVLVGPDGTITWRADYGGAPDYTMFVPTDKMLADLSKERSS
ncbi:peroxiredoxin family protein [Nocardia salmonicida]|uniref:peroxiredoxin family protein n=1 Tax=Nocardia salmonicida TaxID=53431 RepID=UPI0007A4B98D|nr:peroxiredoxin family protein [Nocardia salmonicida]